MYILDNYLMIENQKGITMKYFRSAICLLSLATLSVSAEKATNKIKGFKNTPLVPGTQWHVHDPDRPQPPVVAPKPENEIKEIPKDAIVLFDGTNLDAWENKDWPVKDGVMTVGKKYQVSKQKFGDIQLHLEWRAPEMPAKKTGQQRGNSGIFFMGKYELQVLNCYKNQTYPDGMTAAVYGQHPPLANVCRPTGEWNTYDITFIAPRFKEGKLISPATITVYFNGVLVQDKTEYLGPSTYKKIGTYKAHASKEVLKLQDHGDKVSFRNIWVKEL